MKLSKRHVATLGILLGMTGIVACNSQNTRVSESPSSLSNQAEYAGCIEPTVAEYNEQDSTQVAQNQRTPNTVKKNVEEQPHETADCTLPELSQ